MTQIENRSALRRFVASRTPPVVKSVVRAVTPLASRDIRARLAAGYDDDKDEVGYVREVFAKHVRHTGTTTGRVLEIGPGGNLGVAALYVQAGAEEAVCIDTVDWTKENSELYEQLGVSDSVQRVAYRSPDSIERTQLPAESFDVIFSHAVLEHVAKPAKTCESIARLLRPGGVTSHQIDLRDHRNFGQPLEFLKLGRIYWRLLSADDLAPPNRWRAQQWVEAFERNGLEIIALEPTHVTPVDDADLASFALPFRRMHASDLGITGVHLVARKR